MPLTQLLRILDIYPIQVPTKGSFCWFRPEVILVTTNTQPESWYDYEKRQDSWAALRRRFHYVHDMSEDDPCCWAQVLPIELTCAEDPSTVNEVTSYRRARSPEAMVRRVRPRLMRTGPGEVFGPMDYNPIFFPGPLEDPNDPIEEMDTEETTVVFSTPQ